MRAALYHRVSTIDQNPEAAFTELINAAKQRGHRVVLSVSESGSGAKNNRPGLLEILDAARRGRCDVVMVWKLDRFGRSALDLLGNIRALDMAGVGFCAVTQGIDFRAGGDPMSRLLLTMLAGVAEFERDLISERTIVGMAHAKRKGATFGRPRVERPDPLDVKWLRDARVPWPDVAQQLGCTVHAARDALPHVITVKRAVRAPTRQPKQLRKGESKNGR